METKSEFSGDPLEWSAGVWSDLFQPTLQSAIIDTNPKMNHLKTLVPGKAICKRS